MNSKIMTSPKVYVTGTFRVVRVQVSSVSFPFSLEGLEIVADVAKAVSVESKLNSKLSFHSLVAALAKVSRVKK